jgi:hypothetical protein
VFDTHQEVILNSRSLPKDLQDQVTLVARSFNPVETKESVETHLHGELDNWDAIVLLVDNQMAYEVSQLRNAFFIGQLDLPEYSPNYQNIFSGTVKRLLKNFGFLLLSMSTAESEQAISLPLRNFKSVELTEFARMCQDMALDPGFNDEIAPILSQLLSRRGPKRRTQYPNLFFVDDDDKHFEFGKEVHCKPGSGGDHVVACQMHVKFRFGRKIDSTRHFNVTQGDKDDSRISGDFLDCHGAVIETRKKTHINMFSSDFHD